MRNLKFSLAILLIIASLKLISTPAIGKEIDSPNSSAAEWTFLVYLNGNNNLDSFGTMNLKQMEQIGSTPDVNVVVQWASLKNTDTKRLFIRKDNSHAEVTSQVVESLSHVDMGDSKSLLEFIKWGIKKYPAKHYAIDVWDHGSGWHAKNRSKLFSVPSFHTSEISWDDHTGHSITTKQLAEVLSTASKIIGHKIELYGSDACLMGMTEIADQMSDSVETYVGSEEVEAAAGWPYHKILGRLVQHPQMNSKELGKVITEEFIGFYTSPEGSDQGSATFSAFDLNKMSDLDQAISALGTDLLTVDKNDRSKLIDAVNAAQRFTYDDYADLTDTIAQIESLKNSAVRSETLSNLKQALAQFVITYGSTPALPKAFGASIWFPTSASTYHIYSSKYQELNFEARNHWGEVLKYLLE